MNTNTPEPRSNVKPQSIWNSARVKTKKKLWNFLPKNQRGSLPELPATIKPIAFRSKIFKWGPYQGTIEDILDFAKYKGVKSLKSGAITYKVA